MAVVLPDWQPDPDLIAEFMAVDAAYSRAKQEDCYVTPIENFGAKNVLVGDRILYASHSLLLNMYGDPEDLDPVWAQTIFGAQYCEGATLVEQIHNGIDAILEQRGAFS